MRAAWRRAWTRARAARARPPTACTARWAPCTSSTACSSPVLPRAGRPFSHVPTRTGRMVAGLWWQAPPAHGRARSIRLMWTAEREHTLASAAREAGRGAACPVPPGVSAQGLPPGAPARGRAARRPGRGAARAGPGVPGRGGARGGGRRGAARRARGGGGAAAGRAGGPGGAAAAQLQPAGARSALQRARTLPEPHTGMHKAGA